MSLKSLLNLGYFHNGEYLVHNEKALQYHDHNMILPTHGAEKVRNHQILPVILIEGKCLQLQTRNYHWEPRHWSMTINNFPNFTESHPRFHWINQQKKNHKSNFKFLYHHVKDWWSFQNCYTTKNSVNPDQTGRSLQTSRYSL